MTRKQTANQDFDCVETITSVGFLFEIASRGWKIFHEDSDYITHRQIRNKHFCRFLIQNGNLSVPRSLENPHEY